MGVSVVNNFMLLEADGVSSSQFGVEGMNEEFKYKVSATDGDISFVKPGQIVYLSPGNYQTTKIDETEYTLAKAEDVIGVLDAA